jgi:hypothetical protein
MHDDKIATALGLRPLEEAKNENSATENGKALQETDKTLPESQTQESTEGRIENDSFDIAVQESGSVNPPAIIDNGAEENLEDLEEARQNVKGVIETGDEALREMLEIAKQSEHPRAFEVSTADLLKMIKGENEDG